MNLLLDFQEIDRLIADKALKEEELILKRNNFTACYISVEENIKSVYTNDRKLFISADTNPPQIKQPSEYLAKPAEKSKVQRKPPIKTQSKVPQRNSSSSSSFSDSTDTDSDSGIVYLH